MTDQSPSGEYNGDFLMAMYYGKERFTHHTEQHHAKILLFPWGDPGLDGLSEDDALAAHAINTMPLLNDLVEKAKREFIAKHKDGFTMEEVDVALRNVAYAVFSFGQIVGRAVEEISVVRLMRDGRVMPKQDADNMFLPADNNVE